MPKRVEETDDVLWQLHSIAGSWEAICNMAKDLVYLVSAEEKPCKYGLVLFIPGTVEDMAHVISVLWSLGFWKESWISVLEYLVLKIGETHHRLGS